MRDYIHNLSNKNISIMILIVGILKVLLYVVMGLMIISTTLAKTAGLIKEKINSF